MKSDTRSKENMISNVLKCWTQGICKSWGCAQIRNWSIKCDLAMWNFKQRWKSSFLQSVKSTLFPNRKRFGVTFSLPLQNNGSFASVYVLKGLYMEFSSCHTLNQAVTWPQDTMKLQEVTHLQFCCFGLFVPTFLLLVSLHRLVLY